MLYPSDIATWLGGHLTTKVSAVFNGTLPPKQPDMLVMVYGVPGPTTPVVDLPLFINTGYQVRCRSRIRIGMDAYALSEQVDALFTDLLQNARMTGHDGTYQVLQTQSFAGPPYELSRDSDRITTVCTYIVTATRKPLPVATGAAYDSNAQYDLARYSS